MGFDDHENLKPRIANRSHSQHHRYFWIVARGDDGKPYLMFGSANNSSEATTKAMDLLGGVDFEIKSLPTRDQGKASALLRGKRLENTHNLKTATERIGHEKSLDRLKKKHSKRQGGW